MTMKQTSAITSPLFMGTLSQNISHEKKSATRTFRAILQFSGNRDFG